MRWTPSFGQDRGKERPKLELQQHEAQVLLRLFEEITLGKGLIEIIKQLNREGITGPRGKNWGKTTIHKILTNEAYTGTLVWGRGSKISTTPATNYSSDY